MVGTPSGARAALEGEGELIGEGNSRIARRIGDVVYKIDRSACTNEQEFSVAEAGRSVLPCHVVVPPMTLHHVDGDVVLAMPFVDGEIVGLCPQDDAELEDSCDDCSSCLPVDVARIIAAITPDGVTRGNTLRQGDTYLIIDLDYPPDPLAKSVVRD